VETALREAHEEINLDPGAVEILGVLTPLFIPVSNFSVTPVLACARYPMELRADGLDVIEFRAGIIIGAGSFSFDLVRTLVERLPVMICPAWLATPTQPIAIADIVA